MNRATGLLLIEVVNSNPNGNPDQESDPRLRPDERGMISPVSFKRKLRDLVEDKDGPVWKELSRNFSPALTADGFNILESREHRGQDPKRIESEQKDGTFAAKYWDARVFGNTVIQKGSSTYIKTGVAQFGMGVSICPLDVERMTTTSRTNVEPGKDRGMAPLAYRIVLHGVYAMPYFINPMAAGKSGCTDIDIELMKRTIRYAYSNTSSYIRPDVRIRHAWHIEHKSALGSCPDFALLEALTPKRTNPADKDIPSRTWQDYTVPPSLPEELKSRIASITDLVAVS